MDIHFIAQDLRIRFGKRVLFKDLSFEAKGGELIAITGANGAGKSTLVRILAGVNAPQKGTVSLKLDGHEVAAEMRPLHIGLVAPYLNLYDDFSLVENLSFIAKVRSLSLNKTHLSNLIEEVQLKGAEDVWLQKYSSGMKQRARFAAALLPDPPIFLLDEPTANLDERGKKMVWGFVEKLRQQGKIIIIATNEPSEANRAERKIEL